MDPLCFDTPYGIGHLIYKDGSTNVPLSISTEIQLPPPPFQTEKKEVTNTSPIGRCFYL